MNAATPGTLRLEQAKGLFRIGTTIPKDHLGYLIRDNLACDILSEGSHNLKKGDQVMIAPAGRWAVEVKNAGGFQVTATVAMLRATFHGSDCYEHFFRDQPAADGVKEQSRIVNPNEFIADLIASRDQRITDCESELRRLLIPIGIDLLTLQAVREAGEPDETATRDNDDHPSPWNQSTTDIQSEDSTSPSPDERRLCIRLGMHPELSRSWWRKERLGAFEARLLNAAKRHLHCLQRELAEARSQQKVPRATIQLSWDLCDALLVRISSQRPEQLVMHANSRSNLVNEAKQILSLCEQLAARSVTNSSSLEIIDQGLEELRRALDRRSSSLTGASTAKPYRSLI